MKLTGIQSVDNKNLKFGTSTRVLKNTVSQLSKNNKYSLNEPNQRRIINSITELSKVPNKNVVDFLLNTASKLKYATNIKLEDSPLNNWKEMLINAALGVLALIPFADKSEFMQKIERLKSEDNLNGVEKDILKLREKLLDSVNIEQIQKETIGGIRDFKRNLDYFIVSSETTQEHKKYVLKKLNYLMSDEYQINPQLKDKKSVVAAELVNDMAIYTPGHEAPNIKAVNQKQHGMCAAISIVRKKIVYEDKPNYIDSILSELDSSPYISVYNRTKLGSGEKQLLPKVPVDYEAAIKKGYRIIDASTTLWMAMGQKSGYSATSMNNYTPFDTENFDVNSDSFFNVKFEDPELKELQEYYQSLIKASESINSYMANSIKKAEFSKDIQHEFKKNVKALNNIYGNLLKDIEKLYPDKSLKEVRLIANQLINLEKKYSHKIDTDAKYQYIRNEEEAVKKDKIEGFLRNYNNSFITADSKLIDKIYNNVSFYHVLSCQLRTGNNDIHGLKKAKILYEIGSAVRFQYLKGLSNETTLNYMMKKEHIPNREAGLENMADFLINKLKHGSPEIKDIITQSIANNIAQESISVDDCIDAMTQVKDMLDENSKIMDEIYKSIGLNNKKDALISFIGATISELAYDKKSFLMTTLADNLGVSKNANSVIKFLENIKNKLINDEISYNSVFDILGASSQVSFLNDRVQELMQMLSGENSNDAIETLISANNLDIDNLEYEINATTGKIFNKLNEIYRKNETLTGVLRIKDRDGNLLYTPDPKELIIKKGENNNTIPSNDALQELQEHFDKIQKDRSADEFNSRQGKLKDRSLYKFSPREKLTLSAIEQNIMPVSRHINRELVYIQQYIKEPLEELKRRIGIDMGFWWVPKEGGSGLYDGQEIRILEYITGRPHYDTQKVDSAADKIKKSMYSGISASSVFHDKAGFHAQYIADIEPVEIKVQDENGKINKKTVDVLFQDNSWGASEHENTWVDSNGLMRTDYSDNRGGTLGYITNNKFRNGNLLNRVTGDMILEEKTEQINSRKYKKIQKGDFDSLKTPQYSRIILDGKSPKLNRIADSVQDTMLTPTIDLIQTLKRLTKNMSSEEINSKLHRIKYFKNDWQNISDEFIRRIRCTEGKNAILSQADYDRLPNSDPLKIMLEKTALLNNFYIENIPYDIKNDFELEKYRKIQRKSAVENFEYSFGKNTGILEYINNKLSGVFADIDVEEDEFNGSVKDLIANIVSDFSSRVKVNINNPSKSAEILTQQLEEILKKQLYFDKSDISNPNIQHIINFIDRVYNPSDDAELVRIYNKLQNMTKAEFEKQIVPQLTNEDIKIKDETGYGLLKRIRRYEEGAENLLCNMIYADEILKHTEKTKNSVDYAYNKLSRTPKYLAKYTFDSAYRDIKYDLTYLNLPKMFDKYKGRNIDMYGAYPAYPKTDYISDKVINSIADTFIKPIEDEIQKINDINDLNKFYELENSLKKITRGIKSSDVLNDDLYSDINDILGQIATLSLKDESLANINDAALEALEIAQGEKFKEYKPYIKTIIDTIEGFKLSAPPDMLNNEIENEKSLITKQADILIKTYIRTRYQKNFAKTLQDYKNCLIKNKKLAADYKIKLMDELVTYNLLQDPEEVLDRYIQSLAKDSPLNKYSKSIEEILKRALNFAKLCDIEQTIMDALFSGVETDVKSAFDNIQLKLKDGSTIPMSDMELISHIINSMVLENNYDTAILFIDKLGLNEEYVEYVTDDFDYDELKEVVNENAKIIEKYKKFTPMLTQSYTLACDSIQKGEDAIKTLNELRKSIILSAKKCGTNKNIVNIFLDATNITKLTLEANPKISAEDVLNSVFYSAFNIEYENALKALFDKNDKILESYTGMLNLVNSIGLDSNSTANKKREILNDKFNKLMMRNNQILNELQADK